MSKWSLFFLGALWGFAFNSLVDLVLKWLS